MSAKEKKNKQTEEEEEIEEEVEEEIEKKPKETKNTIQKNKKEEKKDNQEEKYINFDLLYRSIKLIKDYKYKIIPCYINLKQCLNNIKKEKIIQINDKH